MKIFFNGWFDGFMDKTNPGLTVSFFIKLFENVYNEKCEDGGFVNSDILCEFGMMIDSHSCVNVKKWKHTYLFTGESYLGMDKSNYTCVLWGERNYENVVNVPLFIPYLYTNNFVENLENIHLIPRTIVPSKEVCVIISNPNGIIRNKFLDKLGKVMKIDYAGNYKTNIEKIHNHYNTPEFINFVSDYKFIISMENSRNDTYITEKIIHGLLAKTIPIYWGSPRVYDYINKDRILAVMEEDEIDKIIDKMIQINENNDQWIEIINKHALCNIKLERTIEIIARDIRCVINNSSWKNIMRTYCIFNKSFEPDRQIMLEEMFEKLQISKDNVSYICPTYKHTITEEQYNKHIKIQTCLSYRYAKIKKSELSLYLNFIEILENIEKNYKDGIFFTFESDVMIGKNIEKLPEFINFANKIRDKWDLIHLGMFVPEIFTFPVCNFSNGYKVNNERYNPNLLEYVKQNINNQQIFIEDITKPIDEHRLIRKLYCRCTDSFLWNYKSIINFLNHIKNIDPNYGVPFDFYINNFLETNIWFKQYWTVDEFFVQGSNIGLIPSNIQHQD
jgi:hypothetical protein